MEKIRGKGWISTYMVAVVLLWVVAFAWALTEKEPPEGFGVYGNVMTLQDEGAARLFGLKEPGIYVVNQNNKPVTAVRGGLGMILRGLARADIDQASVGWRGLRAGLLRTAPGILLVVLAAGSLLGWIPVRARMR